MRERRERTPRGGEGGGEGMKGDELKVLGNGWRYGGREERKCTVWRGLQRLEAEVTDAEEENSERGKDWKESRAENRRV